MPYDVKTSAPHQLGAVRLSGVVDAGTLLRSIDALYHGETWVPAFHTIWDCRLVTGVTVELDELPPIVARMRALNRRMGAGRTAVVAPNEIVAAFVHMLFVRTACTFRERRVFDDLDGALRWVVETYSTRIEEPGRSLPIAPI